MTITEVANLIVAIVLALAAVAALKDDQRVWLLKLMSVAALVALAIVGGLVSLYGIYDFIRKEGPPGRGEIIFLLVSVFNLIMIPNLALGTWLDKRKARREKARLDRFSASSAEGDSK